MEVEVEFYFLLLIKRYNLFEVLACSTAFFHLSLSCATFFQLCTFIFIISSKTSSSHRNLGLPVGLLAMGFHLLIFFTLLSSVMRSTWRYNSTLSLTSAIDWCGLSVLCPSRFTAGKEPVPMVQEAGWATGSVQTGAENLSHTRV